MTEEKQDKEEKQEEDGPEGGIPPNRTRDLVASTVILQFIGLALYGTFALLVWLFGWHLGAGQAAFLSTMFASQPMGDLYRAGPRRRLAVVATVVTLLTVTVIVALTVAWFFPVMDEHGLDFLAGTLVGMPVAATVLSRMLPRPAPTA